MSLGSPSVREVREMIRTQLAHGADLDRIDASIQPLDLDDEEKAALWLYAWSQEPQSPGVEHEAAPVGPFSRG